MTDLLACGSCTQTFMDTWCALTGAGLGLVWAWSIGVGGALRNYLKRGWTAARSVLKS